MTQPNETPMLVWCDWTIDDDGVYATECGHAFALDSGTPLENGMKFCAYCGGILQEGFHEPANERPEAEPE